METKTSSALEHTVKGVAELEIAKTYVTSYRRKWAFVIFLVILAIAIPIALHFGTTAGMPGHI